MTRFLVLFPVVDSSKNWDRDWSRHMCWMPTLEQLHFLHIINCQNDFMRIHIIWSCIQYSKFCWKNKFTSFLWQPHKNLVDFQTAPRIHSAKGFSTVAMSPNKWTPSAFPLASESVWSNPKHPFWADFHHLLHLSETAETAILAYALPDCWDGIYGHNMDIVNSRYDVFKMGWWFTKLHFNRE